MWKVLALAVELGAEAADERGERIAREERNRALLITGAALAAAGAASAGVYAYVTSDEEDPDAMQHAPIDAPVVEDVDTWRPWPFD